MITVPDSLAALLLCEGESARTWIDGFPALAEQVLAGWDCRPDGEVKAGAVAVVIPVRCPRGRAVVKISFPHPGNVDEHKALAAWGGNGAVRLLDSDPDRFALLLERVNDRHLDVAADEGIAIGGELLSRLAIPAPPGVTRLADTTADWERQVRDDAERADHPLPGRIVDAAVATIRDLGRDSTTTMLHGDLHGGNILRSDRGWLAIDPKGMAGTPAYDAVTMCDYRRPAFDSGVDQVTELHRRVGIFSEAAGVDLELCRRCVQARAVTALLWDLGRGEVPRSPNVVWRRLIAEALVG
ncbi:aminoglycoside phosphotransferase family protein [Microlunatus soli]|uniref:Streptomycin 6-kinase n=1 Tax=Microlunatus soli TaxID=630515 RepID=A0A1H2A4V4_9ACTN|nr:aminoglycoside phosphotransferase family protein [Microlunatus soli]SDT40944.1 streptomycin 6-kinase [Microlunatus soli]